MKKIKRKKSTIHIAVPVKLLLTSRVSRLIHNCRMWDTSECFFFFLFKLAVVGCKTAWAKSAKWCQARRQQILPKSRWQRGTGGWVAQGGVREARAPLRTPRTAYWSTGLQQTLKERLAQLEITIFFSGGKMNLWPILSFSFKPHEHTVWPLRAASAPRLGQLNPCCPQTKQTTLRSFLAESSK